MISGSGASRAISLLDRDSRHVISGTGSAIPCLDVLDHHSGDCVVGRHRPGDGERSRVWR